MSVIGLTRLAFKCTTSRSHHSYQFSHFMWYQPAKKREKKRKWCRGRERKRRNKSFIFPLDLLPMIALLYSDWMYCSEDCMCEMRCYALRIYLNALALMRCFMAAGLYWCPLWQRGGGAATYRFTDKFPNPGRAVALRNSPINSPTLPNSNIKYTHNRLIVCLVGCWSFAFWQQVRSY